MPAQKCQSAAVHWLSHLAQFAEDIVSSVGGIAKTPHRHSQWLPSGVRVVLLCLCQRKTCLYHQLIRLYSFALSTCAFW